MQKLFEIGAKAIITNAVGAVLMVRDINNGKWELPGGRIENEETVLQALRRELREETKISGAINIERIIWAEKTSQPPSYKHGLMLIFFKVNTKSHKKIRLSNEHSECRWLAEDELQNLNTYKTDFNALTIHFKTNNNCLGGTKIHY